MYQNMKGEVQYILVPTKKPRLINKVERFLS